LRNQQSWDVIHFIRALKREVLNNTASIPMRTGARTRYLDRSNQVDAFDIFAEMAAPTRMDRKPTAVLVPVPGSKDISEEDVRKGSTFQIARALGERLNTAVEPCLWWRQAMPSAHKEGGPRHPRILVPNLVLGKVPSGSVVLIDDVLTSGGHLRAADCLIRRAGLRVLFAICAAKTADVEEDDMFKRGLHEIEEFDE
jgi:predicted amidophosphoribosyltransferase